MTLDELRVLHFAFHALAYTVGFVLLVVLPWAVSGRSLRIPAVEVGRWEPRREGRRQGSQSKGSKRRSPPRGSNLAKAPAKDCPSSFLNRANRCKTPDQGSSSGDLRLEPDRDADDAVAACRVLGFAKRESEECVRELRGRMPDAGCGELVKATISKLGKGCA